MAGKLEKWYVLYTYPNLEKKICSLLIKSNINAYLPLQKVYHQWSDRKKALLIPLFPNYVFVRIFDHEYAKVLCLKGVVKLVTFEKKPAIIPENEIDIIRRLENIDVELESGLIKGDKVKIVSGSFAGLEGILIDKIGKKRVIITLNKLRQSLSLEISINHLMKIKSHSLISELNLTN